MKLNRTLLWLVWLAPISAFAQLEIFDLDGGGGITDGRKVLTLSSEWSAEGVEPGQTVHLALKLDIIPGWHINTPQAPQDFIPTRVEVVQAPAGWAITTLFPPEHKVLKIPNTPPIPVYGGMTVIFVAVQPPPGTPTGELPIKLKVSWQACQDSGVCLRDVEVEHEVRLRVVPVGSNPTALNAELFESVAEARKARLVFDLFGLQFGINPNNLFLLWLMAAVGGFLLNLTPCVLPLIPLKIMGLSQASAHRGRCFLLGLTMSLGVAAFWLGMGLAIVSITGFTSINQLFQMPWFTVGVGAVIVVMAMGMCGLFTVRLPQKLYMFNPSHDTMHGSFLFGVMSAVLSTPCTAPFMGTAAAWAATQQNAFIPLSTFTAIGLGMALPYAVLSAFPALVNRMPRTGPASELVKQVMGLLMLAAGAYFAGTGLTGLTVTPPDPPSLHYWWAVAILVVIAGLWLIVRTFRITPRWSNRTIFGSLGVFLLAAGLFMGVRLTDKGPIQWVYYTPQRLEEAQKAGKVVVLEFTAQWCINCQALEHAVLWNDRVVKQFNSPDVAPIKVDLTGKNHEGNKLLEAVGRKTIPLLVVYDQQGREVFKRDNYTVQQVVDAIEEARQ